MMEWYKQNIVTVIHIINTGPQIYCTVIKMFLWKQNYRTEKTNTLLVLCCLSLTLCLCKDTLITLINLAQDILYNEHLGENDDVDTEMT